MSVNKQCSVTIDVGMKIIDIGHADMLEGEVVAYDGEHVVYRDDTPQQLLHLVDFKYVATHPVPPTAEDATADESDKDHRDRTFIEEWHDVLDDLECEQALRRLREQTRPLPFGVVLMVVLRCWDQDEIKERELAQAMFDASMPDTSKLSPGFIFPENTLPKTGTPEQQP